MKTIYQQDKYKRRGRKKIVLSLVVILSASLIGLRLFLPSFGSGVAEFFARPIWGVVDRASTPFDNLVSYLNSKSSLASENEKLREEKARLESIALVYDIVSKENEKMAFSLGYEGVDKKVPAKVLARPPQIPYDTLLISVGKDAGLETGQLVSTYSAIRLGEVGEVDSSISRINLYSSADTKTPAVLAGLELDVILVGRGGGNFEIKLPRNVVVEEGERVVSRDNNSQLIAIIEQVNVRPSDSFQVVLAQYPINLSELRWVEVGGFYTGDIIQNEDE